MNKHWSYEGTYIERIRYICNAKFEPTNRHLTRLLSKRVNKPEDEVSARNASASRERCMLAHVN